MKRKLVIGNWKLNGGLHENQTRFESMVVALEGLAGIDICICVPYPYLFQAQQYLSPTSMKWGAQNVSQFEQGAYTSCVSAKMVADFGASYVLLGHSERRFYTDESSTKAVLRIKRAVDAGITPIYCIGETLAEHQAGNGKAVLAAQLQPLFNLDEDYFLKVKALGLVIAYEPVWAIGAKEAAAPEQAQTMHAYIRSLVAAHDTNFAKVLRIIYGGSVNPKNAQAILMMPDVDGGLLGRASLSAEDFKLICMASLI